MANSVDPDQTAPIGAICSGSTLFASIFKLSVMLGNYLQQTTFSDAFFSWRFKGYTFVLETQICFNPLYSDRVLLPDMIQYTYDDSLCMLWGHRLQFPTKIELLSLEIVLILANSVDPDEMPHYAAFHLGLHCLPKYPFRGFKCTKGQLINRKILITPISRGMSV